MRGKPLAVGHAGERGVVAAASYEARRYGVRSATSSRKAKCLYPQLIFVFRRTDIYKSVSHQVYEIFHEHTDLIEPLSLDEVFLSVTENKQGILLAVDIARAIRQRIHEELNLVASAGTSYNKFLARIASDFHKPDGLCTIHPDQTLDFVTRLPTESFWGVGPVTVQKMHLLGIHNDLQLHDYSPEMLVWQLGRVGLLYYGFTRRIDLRPVEAVWIRESIGCEHMLEKNIHVKLAVVIELYHVATEPVERLRRKDFRGKMLTLKIKFHNSSQIIRSMARARKLASLEEVLPLAKQLLKETEYGQHPIRLIGFSVSNPREGIDERRGMWEQLSFKFSDWGEQLKIRMRG